MSEYRTICEPVPRQIPEDSVPRPIPEDPVPRPTPAAHLRYPSAAHPRDIPILGSAQCRHLYSRHCLLLSHSPSVCSTANGNDQSEYT
ncbi:hypothetical protein PIB30_054133 [Stylosanthes scabra]|uniref:Uncharacterized protein n=1 Tax=Stylosanthes scabra TaxID=79078 RepID=A0ABU6XGX1_9FABA|nr:hypothetical protein [Stylosanthes scabra]